MEIYTKHIKTIAIILNISQAEFFHPLELRI